jgi:hypothetical protein
VSHLRPVAAIAALVALAALLIACGGASSSNAQPSTSRTRTRSTTEAASNTPTQTAAPSASGGSWTSFGGSSSRASVAPGAPAHPRLSRRFARTLDGQVYAQPLIAGGHIYVVTENNTVYSFTTGGRLVWKRHVGTPVPRSDLPCGDIDPTGITGTPVITGGRIYAVAFLRNGHHHVLYGLGLRNGHVAVHANVDGGPPIVQQERGALLATGGRIYVPYGGLDGDCGPYHGYVTSVTTSGRHKISFRDPSGETGIWAPGGISEQSRTLLVATGNGNSGLAGWENAVIRLSRGLRRLGYWAPTNWRALSSGDVDESSLAPLPVAGGKIFQIGKDGVGYLLKHSLGGIGGQLHAQHVCGGGAFGADATRGSLIVTECGGNLYGLRLNGNGFRVAWRSAVDGMVPVIAGDSVFALTRDGTVVQVSSGNGRLIAESRAGGEATSFPEPAAAGHTLVAPASGGFVVYRI